MKFKNPFASLRSKGHSLAHISPFSGWTVLIVFFCIVNIIQLALIVDTVMETIYGESNPGTRLVPPTETVEREYLGRTIENFTARQREYDALRTSYVAPGDPSR